MVPKIFVDTDVIIDYLTDREPLATSSSLLFEMNAEKRIQIFLSSLSINNLHYIARKQLGEKKSVELIEKLIEDLEVVGTGKKEILTAVQANFSDFEDAVQYATALSIGNIEAIITKNIKHFSSSKIAVFSPEIYLRMLGGE